MRHLILALLLALATLAAPVANAAPSLEQTSVSLVGGDEDDDDDDDDDEDYRARA